MVASGGGRRRKTKIPLKVFLDVLCHIGTDKLISGPFSFSLLACRPIVYFAFFYPAVLEDHKNVRISGWKALWE